jgi:hypothetical protein
MKERSLPSSPLTGAKRAALPTSHPAGQSCRFAPIKKLPCLPMLPSKNPHESGILPAFGFLHFFHVYPRPFVVTLF